MITVTVTINGTDVNSWNRWGLRQNPFPQVGLAEFDAGERQIHSLNGEPVRSEEDIRKRLHGFSAEFIDLCVAEYRPGQRVSFKVEFPR